MTARLTRAVDRLAATLLARLLELSPAAQKAFVAEVRREFDMVGGRSGSGGEKET